MHPKNIAAIFFDVGGTLLHVDWPRVARIIGRPESAESLYAAEGDARRSIDRLIAGGKVIAGVDFLVACIESAGLSTPSREQQEALWSEHLRDNLWSRVDEEAVHTLTALQEAGFTLCVISNSEGRVRELLENALLASYFTLIVDSGIEGVSKPDKEIFLRALARAKIEPHHALYVGDIFAIDVVGARSSGMHAALLDRHELYPEPTEGFFVLRSLRSLADRCKDLSDRAKREELLALILGGR